jgi:hypothetical protein
MKYPLGTRAHVTSLLVLSAFSILALGSFQDEAPSESAVLNQAPVASLSAAELYQAYENNEVAADAKYKGQVILVTGAISNIGKDVLDKIYVALDTGRLVTSVQAFFTKVHTNAVASLSKGQTVTLKCRCDGKFGNVLLKNCLVSVRH